MPCSLPPATTSLFSCGGWRDFCAPCSRYSPQHHRPFAWRKTGDQLFFTWRNCGWLLSLVKRGPSNLGLRVCRRRRAAMKQYVGLDVSMEGTKVCVLDGAGVVVF